MGGQCAARKTFVMTARRRVLQFRLQFPRKSPRRKPWRPWTQWTVESLVNNRRTCVLDPMDVIGI